LLGYSPLSRGSVNVRSSDGGDWNIRRKLENSREAASLLLKRVDVHASSRRRGRESNQPIYNVSTQEAAEGAALPGDEPPIPIIHADFPSLGSKSAHLSANLPQTSHSSAHRAPRVCVPAARWQAHHSGPSRSSRHPVGARTRYERDAFRRSPRPSRPLGRVPSSGMRSLVTRPQR